MKLIQADWPAHPRVRAFTTTRAGGVSGQPFDSLNLGLHVGDDANNVIANRGILQQEISANLPAQWLNQIHGVDVIEASAEGVAVDADACWSSVLQQPCIVMTADCLPVCFSNKAGTLVAVAHAGWRGLVDGVLENTLAQFENPDDVLCWFGPAIGPAAFEVGAEVREQFLDQHIWSDAAFKPSANGKWLADIYQLARFRLNAAGVRSIHGGGMCTYNDAARFYSYRREGRTGRMATVIWLAGG